MGFNKDAIFISYNDFGTGGGDAAIASIDKTAALAGTLTYFVSHPAPQFRAMPPAQMHGDTTGGVEWFVSTDGTDAGGSTIRVTKLTDYLGNSPIFTYTSLPVTPYQAPFLADQPGGSVTIFPNTTTTQVQYHNGHLVTALASGTASDGFTYPKGLYYQVDVSGGTPTLLQQGVIDPGVGLAVQMPSVDEDISGGLGFTWMESSSSEYLSMWVGTLSAAGNFASSVAAAGGGFFTASVRIGDYSTTVLDPSDGTTFWSANEYIGSDGDTDIWRTRIVSFSLGMSVTTTSPANGEIVSAPPTKYVVEFSDPYDPSPASINPAGVLVNGNPATAYTIVDDHTISFSFAIDPVSGQGLQQFDVAAGTVKRLSDGDPVHLHTSTFRYDALQMNVVSTVPGDGSVATLPLTSLVVNLNESYDPASVSTSDLVLSVGSVESFALINNQSIRYLLSGITQEGTLSFSLPAGALTDQFGNPSLPYQASVTLDYDTQPFPRPLTAINPKGGLIYETSIQGIIFSSSDTDSFTIETDRGQAITVIVQPMDPALWPTVKLNNNDGGLGQPGVGATAPGPYQDAVIQTVPVPGLLWGSRAPKRYKVTVGGFGGTTGHYNVRLILNAAAELEEHDGPANDTRATAQSLESSFVQLNSGAPKAERGAVVGRVQAGAQPGDVFVSVQSFNFFGGSVVRYDAAGNLMQTITSPEFDRGVVSDIELGPGNVIYVALSTDFFGSVVKGEILKFDLDGKFLGSLILPDDPVNIGYLYPFGFDVAPDGSLWVPQLNSGDLVHVGPAGDLLNTYPLGLQPQDATVGANGKIYVSYLEFNTFQGKILQVDPSTGTVTDFVPFAGFNPVQINATADGGVWLGDISDTLKFDSAGQLTQQIFEFPSFDAQPDPSGDLWIAAFFNGVAKYGAAGDFQFRQFPANGYALGLAVVGIDSADPLPTGLADYYSVQLSAGQIATVAVALLGGSPVTVEFQNAAGTPITQGFASKSIDYVIHDFVVPTTGTYYIKLSGNGEYSVVVIRNAAFDSGGNDSISTAQDLIDSDSHGQRVVLGHAASASVDYSGGFTRTDGLTANGTATFVNNAGRLTDGFFGEAGSFFTSDSLNVTAFANSFTFQILPGTLPMADGLTFTIQGNGPTELGPSGGGLGYGPDFPGSLRGIRNSVAVKFDVYDNAGEGINSTGLFTDGRSPTVPEPGSGDVVVNLDGTGIDLNSQHPFKVDMVYDGAVLTTTIIDTVTLASASQSYVIDIPAQVGGNTAFVGFTGGTGGLAAIQDILTWKFSPSQLTADFYRVDLVAKANVQIETVTPADGAGEFVNLLDPMIGLYDANGNLVAANDNGAPDGRNAQLSYKVPKNRGGTYYIAVSASAATPQPTRGEYILRASVP
jgi:hypothetical protein